MSFVPAEFEPPTTAVLGGPQPELRLRVLAPADTVPDYQAVMGARERLGTVFGPGSTWPAADMTLEQNTADLVRHEAQFHAREAFAYTVWSADGVYLACLYIDPVKARHPGDARPLRHDARCHVWTSNAGFAEDASIFERLKRWLREAWPFRAVAWPGRDIAWDAWRAMP